MRIDVFTLFPELIEGFSRASLLGRAREAALLDLRATTCATVRATPGGPSTTRRSAGERAWC